MSKLSEQIKQNNATAFTHSGKFHADDVFSSALLLYLNPEIRLTRGNKVPEDFDGIVFDIGRGRYDHHQKDSRIRENGIPYARTCPRICFLSCVIFVCSCLLQFPTVHERTLSRDFSQIKQIQDFRNQTEFLPLISFHLFLPQLKPGCVSFAAYEQSDMLQMCYFLHIQLPVCI